jgi:WD40 repeat protein
LNAHRWVAWLVAFSPDSSRLASGGGETRARDDQIIIWDVASGRQFRTIPCPAGGVRKVDFSPDGHWIATADHDGLVKLWDGTPDNWR